MNTRRGKSPFIVEGKLNQHTRQIALNKGFYLGRRQGGVNIFMQQTTPLTLDIGLTGNLGGQNSEADPDEELDDYSKQRDNAFRGNVELRLLLNKRWLTHHGRGLFHSPTIRGRSRLSNPGTPYFYYPPSRWLLECAAL